MQTEGIRRNTGSPSGDRNKDQLATRESQAGPSGVTERLAVQLKPGNASGGKGPQLKETQEATKTEGLAMNLTTPASVQKLQTALHAKAKESPSFRFYALYDKVHRKDVLAFAYECCKANGGAAGVDGQRCGMRTPAMCQHLTLASQLLLTVVGVEKLGPRRGCKRNCVNDHRKRRMGTDGNRQGIDRPTAGRLQEAGRHHRRERPPETTHQSNPRASAAGGTDRSSWI